MIRLSPRLALAALVLGLAWPDLGPAAAQEFPNPEAGAEPPAQPPADLQFQPLPNSGDRQAIDLGTPQPPPLAPAPDDQGLAPEPVGPDEAAEPEGLQVL